jgi:hypothetical protein
MPKTSPERELAGFIKKFTPEVAAQAHDALDRMRRRLPGAIELVYDNYNALAIGFSPTEKTSDAIFSIALYPRWVSLFFLQFGVDLPDPKKLLKGAGTKVRHIVLDPPAILDEPAVKTLMTHALKRSSLAFDETQPNRIVIKSISPKQRPRRPA